jgi:hypothetical protein
LIWLHITVDMRSKSSITYCLASGISLLRLCKVTKLILKALSDIVVPVFILEFISVLKEFHAIFLAKILNITSRATVIEYFIEITIVFTAHIRRVSPQSIDLSSVIRVNLISRGCCRCNSNKSNEQQFQHLKIIIFIY